MDTSVRGTAAILIDFENVYYHFAHSRLSSDVCGAVVLWLRRLNSFISDELKESIISQDAYADFERIPEDVQSDLYLLGAETHFVLGTDHKNAADMKLCIDAMKILYTRPDIRSFVLVAGDRDYIPLIRHLRLHNKTVRVVGFTGAVAGDLLTTVGSENFLDGQRFFDAVPAPVPPAPVTRAASAGPTPAPEPGKAPRHPTPADELIPEPSDNDRAALRILFRHFPGKPEIWLTPYLHRLRAELGNLAEFERRELITRLSTMGAISVEKRPGEPNPFSVLKVNWNHPLVRQEYDDSRR